MKNSRVGRKPPNNQINKQTDKQTIFETFLDASHGPINPMTCFTQYHQIQSDKIEQERSGLDSLICTANEQA